MATNWTDETLPTLVGDGVFVDGVFEALVFEGASDQWTPKDESLPTTTWTEETP